MYFSNFVVIVPNAPTIIGITKTFFLSHNQEILFFNKRYFSIFSRSLSHILVYPDTATYIIFDSFFTLSTTSISGLLLASIIWSHCVVKFHRIFKFPFSTTFSCSFSYQSLALLNLSSPQNYHVHTFLHYHVSCLYSIRASLPHLLTMSDIVSFFVPHILQKCDSAVLSIFYLIQLALRDCYWISKP